MTTCLVITNIAFRKKNCSDMDLTKIMAVSGKPGLYQMVAKTRNGLVVESLLDGKRMPVFATDRSSALEDISIFTYEKDVPLKEVLWAIHQKYDGEKGPDPKSTPDEIKAAFEEVLPDYDKERVHVSDMKKVFAWYNILLEKDMISKPEEEEEEGKEDQDTDEPDTDEGDNQKENKDKPTDSL